MTGMSKLFPKGSCRIFGPTFTTRKIYSQRTKRDHETYPWKSMDLPPTVGHEIKN